MDERMDEMTSAGRRTKAKPTSDCRGRVPHRRGTPPPRLGGNGPIRMAGATRVLLAAVAAASFIACGDSGDDRKPAPTSTWDEMRWDEGVWQ